MLPTLEIGPWQMSSYLLAYVLAALLGDVVGLLRLLRLDLSLVAALRTVLLVTVAGFAGAYLVRVIPSIQFFFQTGAWQWIGGSSFIGGLLAGIGALALCCRHYRIPLGSALDQLLPALALTQAVGRLGCLAAGCCYGRPTTSPLGLYLPDHHGEWAVRYPTQPLSAGTYLLIAGLLFRIEARIPRKNRPPGFLALLYVGLYCLERFLAEFLRADALPALGPVSWAQLYAALGLALAGALLLRQRMRTGNVLTPEAS